METQQQLQKIHEETAEELYDEEPVNMQSSSSQLSNELPAAEPGLHHMTLDAWLPRPQHQHLHRCIFLYIFCI